MASKNKRKYCTLLNDTDTDTDTDNDIQKRYWPSWLVIRATQENKTLKNINPFLVEKAIIGLSGKPKDIKQLRDGSFLVEMATRKHSEMLLKSKMLINIPIEVSAHKTLNTTKGVIRCKQLNNVPDEEIITNLASQGVIEVHRVTVRKGSERVPSGTYFITFSTTRLPESLKVGWMHCPVSQYIPSPMRCFKCQKFGHTRTRCSEEEVCGVCCKAKHEGVCENPALCANCGGKHPSSSKECPVWQQEKEIQCVKTTERISFRDARKIVMARQPQAAGTKTYACAVKKTMVSAACQTDSSLIENDKGSQASSRKTLQDKTAPGGGAKPATPVAPGGGSKPANPVAPGGGSKPTASPAKQGKKPAPPPKTKEGQGPQSPSGTKGLKVVMPEKVAATKVTPKVPPASSRLKKAERNGTRFANLMESDEEQEVDMNE